MKALTRLDILKIKLRQTPDYKMTSDDQITAHLASVWHLWGMGYTGSVLFSVEGILRAITGQEVV
jgi:hypothetical protein